MTVQVVRRPAASPDATAALAAHFPPLLARIYAARDVRSPTDVDHSLRQLQSFDGLRGIEAAIDLLTEAVTGGQRILIIGDFDADGATSTAVAVRALRALGACEVDYLVPNRFEFGYGLSPEIVDVAAESKPDLIITVDNGISSHEGVARAKAHGIRVLITDHHLPPDVLPDADAIVNPNQVGDNSALGALAGVGVIFYVCLALRARLRDAGWFATRDEPNLAKYLDLVAVGTVADVAPLDRNNRVLVAQGLSRVRRGLGHPGIVALLRAANREAARVSATDLGFAVGPRLNAAGRLTDMRLGIECLLCDDETKANEWAARLDALNRERRTLEADMTVEAQTQLESLSFDGEGELPGAVCLFDEAWHPGIVGIIASRVKDQVHRPVIAFAPESDDALKGSGRSVSALHIRDAIDAVATAHPHLIQRFGGHAMAAGLTVRREHFDEFTALFAEIVASRLPSEAMVGRYVSDGELAPEEVHLDAAQAVRDAGPWGQDFPEPIFDAECEVRDQRIVGGKHAKYMLRLDGMRHDVEAIHFNADPFPTRSRVRIAYRLDVNHFRGQSRLQLIVEYAERLN